MPSPCLPARSFISCVDTATEASHDTAARYLKHAKKDAVKSGDFDQLFEYGYYALISKNTSAALVAKTIDVLGRSLKRIDRHPAPKYQGVSTRLRPLLRRTCMSALVRHMGNMAVPNLCNCLWALRNINRQSPAPTDIEAEIQARLSKKINDMSAHDQSLALWAVVNSDLNVLFQSPEYQQNIFSAMLRSCSSMDGKEVGFNCRSLMLLNPINDRALANLLISLFHRASTIKKLLPQDAIPICLAYHYFKVAIDLSAADIGPIQLRSERGTRHTTSSAAQTEITTYLNAQLEADDQLQEEVLLHVIPVDMYCKNKRIAVEVDGSQHRTPKKQRKDRQRDRIRQRNGITTIRLDLVNYSRKSVEEQQAILNRIAKAIRSKELGLLIGLPSLSVYRAIEKAGVGLFNQMPTKRKREKVEQPSIAKAAYQ